jgi:hypothetical protein
MYGWIFKKVGWKFFAVGAATALVGSRYVRPAAVTLVKGGMGVADAASRTWNEAKAQGDKLMAEAASIKADAAAAPEPGSLSSDLVSEIRSLRDEIASMKIELASKASV